MRWQLVELAQVRDLIQHTQLIGKIQTGCGLIHDQKLRTLCQSTRNHA